MRRSATAVFLALAACSVGCSDLRDWDGTYEGRVVGTDGDSFIRRGFPAGTSMTLGRFSPPPSESTPGTLTTSDGVFDGTPLQLIAPLEHDQLSQYDFPGGGRVRSYIFATEPTSGPLAGREPMVFASLMEYDAVEVRVIAGSGDEDAGDHFGLFLLLRQ